MYQYSPRPGHAIVTALLCVVFIALGWKAQGRVLMALNVGALLCAIVTAIVLWVLILEALNERVRVMVEFANAIGKLDEEARAMMAFEFPRMRYRMKAGEVREYFEDTNVPIELFRLFLQTSNNRYISPERDWNTTERPRWAWLEIKSYLEENKYILADSAAGSHSWLWSGESYNHLFAYWMAGRNIRNLNGLEAA